MDWKIRLLSWSSLKSLSDLFEEIKILLARMIYYIVMLRRVQSIMKIASFPRLLPCVAALAFMLVPFPAFAQTWDAGGGGDTAWDQPDNWVGDTLPDPTDTVAFGTAGSAANLNGARTVDTLILNRAGDFTISDSLNSESGLTITSGNLTFGDGSVSPPTARRAYIDSNVTLGANGTWVGNGTQSRLSPGLTVNGSIRGAFGITLDPSSMFLDLAGNNTFTGGVTLNSWVNGAIMGFSHTGALGTGNLIVKGGPASGNAGAVYFGTKDAGQIAVFNNSINFDSTTSGSIINFSADYGASLDQTDYSAGTQIKSLTGTSSTGVYFVAASKTWRIDEGITMTGGSVNFSNNSAAGRGTFEVGGAGGVRAIVLRNTTSSTHGSNLLFTESGTQSGSFQIWEGSTPLSGAALGITHAGTTTFSGLQDLFSAPSGVNYIALNPASRLNVSGLIDDRAAGSFNLRINDNFTVNVAGTHTVSGTNTPTGTVEFSRGRGKYL